MPQMLRVKCRHPQDETKSKPTHSDTARVTAIGIGENKAKGELMSKVKRFTVLAGLIWAVAAVAPPAMPAVPVATGQNWAANEGWTNPATGYWHFKTATAADNVCLLQSGTGQISGGGSFVQR